MEALATLMVVLLIFVALAQYLDCVQNAWGAAAADPFAEASSAFETIARTLATATLEPYSDYVDATGVFRVAGSTTFTPDHVTTRSDLAFACGPSAGPGGLLTATGRTTSTGGVFFIVLGGQTQTEAQEGLNRLLNAEGYFIEFGGDSGVPSFFTGFSRQRWRLKEIVQPSEALQIFASTTSAPWIAGLAGSSATPSILAENVVALVIVPEKTAVQPIGNFSYDSRDATNVATFAQLPPLVHVVLVAIDEPSATRLAAQNGTTAPALVPGTLFQDATQVSADVTALDGSLTAARIGHRIFQRDVTLSASPNAP